jgi:hypothetical protein
VKKIDILKEQKTGSDHPEKNSQKISKSKKLSNNTIK